MKPYKATYPDGTTIYLTKDEAVTVVATAQSAIEPKGAQRTRAEARGLLQLFDEEGLDGLYFENVTITPRHRISPLLLLCLPVLLLLGSALYRLAAGDLLGALAAQFVACAFVSVVIFVLCGHD